MLEKYISIIWAIIKDPYSYFSQEMPKDGTFKDPLLFAVIVLSISLTVYLTLLMTNLSAFLPSIFGAWVLTGTIIGALVFFPFIICASLFISAFLTHSFLFLVFPKISGFKQTFDVLAYSCAAFVLIVVPFVGPLVCTVFNIRALVFGLCAVHNVSALKIFMLLVIIPIIIMTALAMAFIGIFGEHVMLQYNQLINSL